MVYALIAVLFVLILTKKRAPSALPWEGLSILERDRIQGPGAYRLLFRIDLNWEAIDNWVKKEWPDTIFEIYPDRITSILFRIIDDRYSGLQQAFVTEFKGNDQVRDYEWSAKLPQFRLQYLKSDAQGSELWELKDLKLNWNYGTLELGFKAGFSFQDLDDGALICSFPYRDVVSELREMESIYRGAASKNAIKMDAFAQAKGVFEYTSEDGPYMGCHCFKTPFATFQAHLTSYEGMFTTVKDFTPESAAEFEEKYLGHKPFDDEVIKARKLIQKLSMKYCERKDIKNDLHRIEKVIRKVGPSLDPQRLSDAVFLPALVFNFGRDIDGKTLKIDQYEFIDARKPHEGEMIFKTPAGLIRISVEDGTLGELSTGGYKRNVKVHFQDKLVCKYFIDMELGEFSDTPRTSNTFVATSYGRVESMEYGNWLTELIKAIAWLSISKRETKKAS